MVTAWQGMPPGEGTSRIKTGWYLWLAPGGKTVTQYAEGITWFEARDHAATALHAAPQDLLWNRIDLP